jgi:hypothetical protein
MLRFGKPISLESANNQIKEYLNLKTNTTHAVGENLREKANRYYGNGNLSFVFEREILEHILSTPWCNGLRVYYACMDQDQTGFLANAEEKTTLPSGTPTMILVPVTIHGDGTIINIVPHSEKMIAGGEHPCIIEYQNETSSFDLRTD